MPFDFPNNPTNGQTVTSPGGTYKWDGVKWTPAGGGGSGGGGGATVIISDTPPASPTPSELWWDSVGGNLFIYYTDPSSSEWVITNTGTGGDMFIDAPADGSLYGRSNLAWAKALPLAGGSLTGPLSLPGNATQPLQATTLQQMNAAISAINIGNYLPLTGGKLTGWLVMGNASGQPADAASPTTQPFISAEQIALPVGNVLSWNLYNTASAWQRLQAGYGAFTYLDTTGVLNFYVFASGAAGSVNGSATGALTLGQTGQLQVSGLIRSIGGHVVAGNAGPNNSGFCCYPASGWAAGLWGDGTNLYLGGMDGNGNPATWWLACRNQLAQVNGQLSIGASTYGGATPLFIQTSASGNPGVTMNNTQIQWCVEIAYNDSSIVFYDMSYGYFTMKMMPNGQGTHIYQTLYADGSRVLCSGPQNSQPCVSMYDTSSGCSGFWYYAGALRWGAVSANGVPAAEYGYFTSQNFYIESGNFLCANAIYFSYASNTNCWLGFTGAAVTINFWPQWHMDFRTSDGALIWYNYQNTAYYYSDPAGGNFIIAGQCYAAGYPGPSDRKLKDDVQPWQGGLKELLQLEPVSWRWNGKRVQDDGRRHVGFSAQDVMPIIPECTHEIADLDENNCGFLALDQAPINAAVINALKEINARLMALESH